MRKYLFFILFLLTQTIALAQTRRALVVGIGQYPEESGWRAISGDRDVDLVKKTLFVNGFKEQDIAVLMNSEATFQNIKSAFDKLVKTAKMGDVVYIHFSTHGQQVTDLDGDEIDGFDEAIVPYDAPKNYVKGVYEGQNHITDDLLYTWLSEIKDKVGYDGRIVVISDACHSGDGSRDDDDDAIIRGTDSKFVIPCETKKRASFNKPIRWVFVSACKSYQTNYEYVEKKTGERFGRLTYILYDMEQTTPMLGKTTADGLEKLLRNLFILECDIPQTPAVESNEMDLKLF